MGGLGWSIRNRQQLSGLVMHRWRDAHWIARKEHTNDCNESKVLLLILLKVEDLMVMARLIAPRRAFGTQKISFHYANGVRTCKCLINLFIYFTCALVHSWRGWRCRIEWIHVVAIFLRRHTQGETLECWDNVLLFSLAATERMLLVRIWWKSGHISRLKIIFDNPLANDRIQQSLCPRCLLILQNTFTPLLSCCVG